MPCRWAHDRSTQRPRVVVHQPPPTRFEHEHIRRRQVRWLVAGPFVTQHERGLPQKLDASVRTNHRRWRRSLENPCPAFEDFLSTSEGRHSRVQARQWSFARPERLHRRYVSVRERAVEARVDREHFSLNLGPFAASDTRGLHPSSLAHKTRPGACVIALACLRPRDRVAG